jgi:uncharacterized protein YutD
MLLCPKVLRPIVFVNKKIKKFCFFQSPVFALKNVQKSRMATQIPRKQTEAVHGQAFSEIMA